MSSTYFDMVKFCFVPRDSNTVARELNLVFLIRLILSGGLSSTYFDMVNFSFVPRDTNIAARELNLVFLIMLILSGGLSTLAVEVG